MGSCVLAVGSEFELWKSVFLADTFLLAAGEHRIDRPAFDKRSKF